MAVDRWEPPACPVCGEPVRWSTCRNAWNRFCSHRCAGKARSLQLSRPERWETPPPCPICGEPVPWVNGHWQTYCSRKCRGMSQRKTTEGRKSPQLSWWTGVPMAKALTPSQCREMRRFLRLVLTAGRRARELGERVDVMELIRQWRDGMWEPETADRSAWVELVGDAADTVQHGTDAPRMVP